MSLRPPFDPDMWWHLKTGAYIWQFGLPYQDPGFAYTTSSNLWITHEWLTELLMIGIYQIAGLIGLALTFAALITGAFFLLYRVSDGRPYAAGLATLWGAAAALPFFGTRPQMINILGGAVVIYVVEQVRHGRINDKWLWALIPLIIVWVNMHGGFLLGIAILGVYLVGEGVARLLGRSATQTLSFNGLMTLFLVTVLSAAASLINPFGFQMLTYAYETTLTSEAMQTFIVEWHSPNFQTPIFWLFGSLMIGIWVVMVFSKRPVSLTELLFILGTTYAALQSKRNIPIFAIVTVPIMARHLVGVFENTPWFSLVSGGEVSPPPNRRLKLLNNFLGGIIFAAALGYVVTETIQYPESVAESLPTEAITYIKDNDVDVIFNEYAWGGYMIWQEVPPFIDGRADLYGDEFFEKYMRTYQIRADWQDALDSYGVKHVFIRVDSPLDVLLQAAPDWQTIYRDETAVIFKRRS